MNLAKGRKEGAVMLRDDIARYTELSGNDGEHTPIGIIGAFLDGYETGLKVRPKGQWIERKEEKHTCSNCQHRNPVDDNEYRCFMRASKATRLGSDTCKLWE